MITAFRLSPGASSSPAMEQNVMLMIQAQRRTRIGFSPVIDRRSGLSTTPRMANPIRT